MKIVGDFFWERMKPLGLTEENNKMTVYNPEVEAPASGLSEIPIFKTDQHGNIVISYWTIDGEQIVYYTDAKTPMPRFYETKRLAKPTGDRKYNMPKGRGVFPWWHPITVKAYKEGEKIETLYLTEGVFKAWKGGQYGIHVCGLSSITHYADSETKKLHPDIVKVIEKCDVDNVVILHDGDCYNVSEKGIKVREEATKRPFSFFNAAKKTRKLILEAEYDKSRQAPRIFYMNIQPHSFPDNPKGLDDLFISAEKQGGNNPILVAENINPTKKQNLYFFRMDISSTTDRLYRHFSLNNHDDFYNRHSFVIGADEFIFKGDVFQYSEVQNKLRLLQPDWGKSMWWIGDELFEDQVEPSAYGNRRKLVHRKVSTIIARYGKDFRKYLTFFNGFVNVPNNFNYQRIIEIDGKEYYNRYHPFQHIPRKGKFPTIDNFLKHIFGTHEIEHPKTKEKIPSYIIGYDYLSILLREPTQLLPIIVLYSQENQTGKSTFGQLQKKILGDNAVFVSNSDLQSNFNEVYADKLLAICEETSLERKKDAQRIKNMSTATQMVINPKGQKQYEIDFFCKFQFYSNDSRMVYVTRHDDRYWIIKVPAIPKDQLDPSIPEEMESEIPAFVHFLRERELATTRESRMHFNPILLQTQTFLDTVKINEPQQATDFRNDLSEYFLDFPEKEELLLPMKLIQEEFFTKGTSKSWIREIIKDHIGAEQFTKDGKIVYMRGDFDKFFFDEYADEGEGAIIVKSIKWKGRPYLFKRETFVKEEVYRDTDDQDDFFEDLNKGTIKF